MSNPYAQHDLLRQGELISSEGLTFEVIGRTGLPQRSFDFSSEVDYQNGQAHLSQVYRAHGFEGIVQTPDRAIKIYTSPVNKAMAPISEVKYIEEFGGHANFPEFVVSDTYQCSDGRQRIYVASEYVDGGTLSEVARGNNTIDDSQKLKVIADCLGGLSLLHSEGLVHRDVKLPNIGITTVYGEDGSDVGGVLLDLGQVSRIGDKSAGITLTKGFDDPEIVAGAAPSPRHDIFATGRVLELTPFENQDVAEGAGRIATMMTARAERPDALTGRELVLELRTQALSA